MGSMKDKAIQKLDKKTKSGKGKGKSSGDYDGWILRLIDKIEDIRYSFSVKEWEDFARAKILGSGYESKEGKLTSSQKEALDEIRSQVWEVAPTKLNINPEYITRYRGATTGRFVEKTAHGFRDTKTGRFVKAVPEKSERYRAMGKDYASTKGKPIPKGGYVHAPAINAEIKRLKADKTWLKTKEAE